MYLMLMVDFSLIHIEINYQSTMTHYEPYTWRNLAIKPPSILENLTFFIHTFFVPISVCIEIFVIKCVQMMLFSVDFIEFLFYCFLFTL